MGALSRHRPPGLILWLAAVALVCPLSSAANEKTTAAAALPRAPGVAAAQNDRPVQYRQTHELGISRCSLPGVLGNADVTLHVWIRLVPPSSTPQPAVCAAAGASEADRAAAGCGRVAAVRGFAFLQDHRRSVTFGSPMIQMVQSVNIRLFKDRKMYLRSAVTEATYPLTLSMPEVTPKPVVLWWFGEKKRIRGQTTNHVIDVTGPVTLDPKDVHEGMVDLELRVDGFLWHCNVLSQPGVFANSLSAPTPTTGTKQQQQTGAAVAARARDLPDWRNVDRASLTKTTQVWVLLSPFHGVSLKEYALTLWYHVIWHRSIGVTKYLLYVTERIGKLLAEPLIQALIRQDVLEVVLFTEMSKHEWTKFKPDLRDKYAMQVIQYNHAALSLWGTDTLLLSIDLDEYVTTSAPMSVVEMVTKCADTSNAAADSALKAGLQLARYEATCRPNADKSVCDPEKPYHEIWLSSEQKILDVLSGKTRHPVDSTTFTTFVPREQWDQKPLLDPNLALDVHVHDFMAAPGAVSRNATHACARLLHILDFYYIRRKGADGKRSPEERPEPVSEKDTLPWFWTVDKVQKDAQKQG